MGSFLYIAIIAAQLASTLATQKVPLKCFLRDSTVLNIFGTSAVRPFSYGITKTNYPRFGILKGKSNTFEKNGWVLDAKNIEFHGLDDAIIDDFGFNLVNNVAQLTFHTDMLVTYNYKSNGTLFSKPITGEGFTQVPLKNLQMGMSMPFDFVDTNGSKFLELRNYNYWFDVRDHAEFSFSNLYYGNKEESDSMHCLMNNNWKYITKQYGKGFMDHVAESVFNVFRNYLLDMPLRDLSTC